MLKYRPWLKTDVKTVCEVWSLSELLEQIHAVAATTVTRPNSRLGRGGVGVEDILRTLFPPLARPGLLARHSTRLLLDVDEGSLYDGEDLQVGGDHHPTRLHPAQWDVFPGSTKTGYLEPPGQMMRVSSTRSSMLLLELEKLYWPTTTCESSPAPASRCMFTTVGRSINISNQASFLILIYVVKR